MAALTFDLSGLTLLENAVNAMLGAPASSFVGGAVFGATYSVVPGNVPPGTMTTGQLQQRLTALRAAFDRLPL
jgi:hypothetical protein